MCEWTELFLANVKLQDVIKLSSVISNLFTLQ